MNEWDPEWGAIKKPDPTVWVWDVVGEKIIIIKVPHEVSWWKRFKTRLLLGSKWTRVNKLNNKKNKRKKP